MDKPVTFENYKIVRDEEQKMDIMCRAEATRVLPKNITLSDCEEFVLLEICPVCGVEHLVLKCVVHYENAGRGCTSLIPSVYCMNKCRAMPIKA